MISYNNINIIILKWWYLRWFCGKQTYQHCLEPKLMIRKALQKYGAPGAGPWGGDRTPLSAHLHQQPLHPLLSSTNTTSSLDWGSNVDRLKALTTQSNYSPRRTLTWLAVIALCLTLDCRQRIMSLMSKCLYCRQKIHWHKEGKEGIKWHIFSHAHILIPKPKHFV